MTAIVRPAPAAPRRYSFPSATTRRLPNGMRVVVAPVRRLPVVTLHVVIDAGASHEPLEQNGTSLLTARALAEGTMVLSASELAERFETLGSAIEPESDWDRAEVACTFVSSRFDQALELLRDVLLTPALPDAEIGRVRDERVAELLQQLAEPRGLADDMFVGFVYHPSSRYARPEGGTLDTIRTLGAADVRAFYERRYRPEATTLVVVGDVDADRAFARVTAALADWESGPAPAPNVDVVPAHRRRSVHLVERADAPQSELRIGHIGLPRRHPDFFGVTVMNAILGGLFNSRINLNLRERNAYTYGASSHFEWRRQAGPFIVSAAVHSEATAAAVREVLIEIDRMRSEPPLPEELSLAVEYLTGIFPIRFETASAIANALAVQSIYELPPDYFDTYRDRVRAVTSDEVLRCAQIHLEPDMLQIVAVGDRKIVEAPLGSLDLCPFTVYDAEGHTLA
jgi:zinc protease